MFYMKRQSCYPTPRPHKRGTGYVIEGLLINGNYSLNVCFKDGAPHVLKVLTPSEYNRMKAWKEVVSVTRELCRYIVWFDAVNVN